MEIKLAKGTLRVAGNVDLVLLRAAIEFASRDTDLDLTSVAVLNHITRFGLLHDPGKTCAHDEIWARHRYWEPSVPPNYYELSQGFG